MQRSISMAFREEAVSALFVLYDIQAVRVRLCACVFVTTNSLLYVYFKICVMHVLKLI